METVGIRELHSEAASINSQFNNMISHSELNSLPSFQSNLGGVPGSGEFEDRMRNGSVSSQLIESSCGNNNDGEPMFRDLNPFMVESELNCSEANAGSSSCFNQFAIPPSSQCSLDNVGRPSGG